MRWPGNVFKCSLANIEFPVVRRGFQPIGMHTFVDATIRFDSERSFSCNAGTVITFDSENPSILLFYVPVTTSSPASFENIQVI